MSSFTELPKRKRSKDTTLLEISNRGSRIIRLPFHYETYSDLVGNTKEYRVHLDGFIEKFPELFPEEINSKYTLFDIRFSNRQALYYRRIECNGIKYTIQPSFITPYWTAQTKDVWYPLLLLNYGTPYWLISQGFGHTDDFWYRLFRHLGHFNIVGTTTRRSGEIPVHLAADEKISWWHGKEIYVCTTAANDCLFGAEPALGEDTESLQAGYGVFLKEAQQVNPDYTPKTVSCDGWPAARKAWTNLCSNVLLILCFLHGYIKIRQCSKRLPNKKELMTLLWDAYREESKEDFIAKINELDQWVQTNVSHNPVLQAVKKIKDRVEEYAIAYDEPKARRTSNMVDRPMRRLDRFLFVNQYFHGHFSSAQLLSRAFALCYNFIPLCPRAIQNNPDLEGSRAARYNQFKYHDNWLDNLLISASLNGFRTNPQLS